MCVLSVCVRAVCVLPGLPSSKHKKKNSSTPTDIGFAVADSVVGRFEKRPLPTELSGLGDAYSVQLKRVLLFWEIKIKETNADPFSVEPFVCIILWVSSGRIVAPDQTS